MRWHWATPIARPWTVHAALLRQVAPFRARPKAFTALLAERAGIGCEDLETFEALHDRAHQHRRAATMRQVHRTRREAEGESPAFEGAPLRSAPGFLVRIGT